MWFGSNINVNFHDNPSRFKEWHWDTVKMKDKENVTLVMNILYSIWRTRNKMAFEESSSTYMDIIAYARDSTMGRIQKLRRSTKVITIKSDHVCPRPRFNGKVRLNWGGCGCSENAVTARPTYLN